MNSKKLLQQYRMGKRDFVGIEVRDCYLSWENLQEANLRDADFSLSIMEGVDLTAANLSAANLSRADLTAANFYKANLFNADLRGADLRGAELAYANLLNADLRGASITGADFSNAILPDGRIIPDRTIIQCRRAIA